MSNYPYVYCTDCGKDITLETEYYDTKGHVYCEECNLEYGYEDHE